MAEIWVLLYVGHLLGDYPMQTDHQAAHKARGGWCGWKANITHASVHAALSAALLAAGVVVLEDVAISPIPAALAVAWIGATHALIDRRWPIQWWMERTGQSEFAGRGGAVHVDQAAHVLALTIAAVALAP